MKKTCKVMLCRFPGNFSEHPDSVDWFMQTRDKCLRDPRIEEVKVWQKSDTPITMSRNKALHDAQRLGMDYVLMLDSDMRPDQSVEGAQPFWETAFNFLWDREAPSIIAAPYVGGGSYHNNIFIFRWRNKTNLSDGFSLQQYTREEAAERTGIEEVAALPTGVFLMDMRVLDRMDPFKRGVPWFYYEWTDAFCDTKASTEDVTFTRDAAFVWQDVPGAGCFCAWDCWAEHIKPCHIGKPEKIYPREALAYLKHQQDNESAEELREMNLSFPDSLHADHPVIAG